MSITRDDESVIYRYELKINQLDSHFDYCTSSRVGGAA